VVVAAEVGSLGTIAAGSGAAARQILHEWEGTVKVTRAVG